MPKVLALALLLAACGGAAQTPAQAPAPAPASASASASAPTPTSTPTPPFRARFRAPQPSPAPAKSGSSPSTLIGRKNCVGGAAATRERSSTSLVGTASHPATPAAARSPRLSTTRLPCSTGSSGSPARENTSGAARSDAARSRAGNRASSSRNTIICDSACPARTRTLKLRGEISIQRSPSAPGAMRSYSPLPSNTPRTMRSTRPIDDLGDSDPRRSRGIRTRPQ